MELTAHVARTEKKNAHMTMETAHREDSTWRADWRIILKEVFTSTLVCELHKRYNIKIRGELLNDPSPARAETC
jgi:hypothetical protein